MPYVVVYGPVEHWYRMKKSLVEVVFSLVFLMSVTAASGQRTPDIELTGTYEWQSASIVGISGLEVEDGGHAFQAIGDRGWYLSGHFERTHNSISGVDLRKYLPILGLDGWPASARRVGDWSDAEGLAIGPNGDMWIAFERWARVIRYTGPQDSGTLLQPHPSFSSYPDNRQLESLALDPAGILYAFAEAPLPEGFAIYKLENGSWAITGHIARRNRYSIVGADFDAQGQLYLLERRLVLGIWWQSRIRRLVVERPDVVTTLWTSRMGTYGNLEGIAAWQDGPITYLTVVSDNNGEAEEITQFLEFRVNES